MTDNDDIRKDVECVIGGDRRDRFADFAGGVRFAASEGSVFGPAEDAEDEDEATAP